MAKSDARALPPRDLDDLRARAFALAGRRVDDAARALGLATVERGLHTKGKMGELVERLLGATGGSTATHDFPSLEVELKTVPVDREGRPRESTYVCRVSLAEAERAEWNDSWARRKLSHVLFVPVIVDGEPTFAQPVFFRPTSAQERVLRADFEDLLGAIGAGHVEDLTARDGQVLQLRPKAKDGSVRTLAFDRDGTPIETSPRGFYMRARYVGAILRDPAVDFDAVRDA